MFYCILFYDYCVLPQWLRLTAVNKEIWWWWWWWW